MPGTCDRLAFGEFTMAERIVVETPQVAKELERHILVLFVDFSARDQLYI